MLSNAFNFPAPADFLCDARADAFAETSTSRFFRGHNNRFVLEAGDGQGGDNDHPGLHRGQNSMQVWLPRKIKDLKVNY